MDEMLTGWLLDLYADEKAVTLWLLEENGQRRKLTHVFPATFYAAGDSIRLRALWSWLSSQDIPVRLSRTERKDVFQGMITVLAVEVVHAPQLDLLFRQAVEFFPDLTYYDADVSLSLRYAAAFGVFPLARCRVVANADRIQVNSLLWLPKENRLAEIVRENMAQGRKTLVFVEQSGTRDIRSRLESALESLVTEEAHLVSGRPLWVTSKPRVGILSASYMSPAKREAWIKLNAPQMDVLVVNPKLIETGLDLVQFSSLFFYETTVSLYILWQAMRRVWRLGQDKEVNVTFLAYGNTVEEEILRRMGQKKKAAQLLYGKEAAGVLVETDSDDVQREMIQAAIEGRAFRSAGDLAQSLFSDGTEKKVLVSTEPAGSMMAASLPIVILQLEPARKASQMTLFGEIVPADAGGRRRRR